MMNNCTNNFIKRVIGVTRTFKWTITTNGAAVPLVAEDLTLQLVPPRGEAVSLPFDVDDNVVSFTWQGDDQHIIGCYSLILWANYGEDNQRRVDIHNFVELIPWSDRQSGEYSDLVEETIELETADFGENIMVVDNLNSTSATDALSANMGRQLNVTKQDVIQDLAAIRSGAAAGAAVKEWAKNDPLITDDATQASASRLNFNGNLFEQWVPGIAASIGLKGIAGFLKLADISQWDSAYNDRMLPTVAAVKAKLQAVLTALGTIEAVIPSQASSTNKLTDKDYVDGAIATNTANFVGTFDSLAELQAVQNPTKNDYGFVIEQDAQGNEYYDRYKYTGTQWLYEYKVESTPFTTEQWAAIQSGITAALVTKLSALPTNAELNTALASKQPVINDLTTIRSGAAAGATAYQKPSGGIPASDMASAVQTSLGKADAAAPQSTTYTKTEVDAALATKQTSSQIATVNGSDLTHGGNVTIVAAEGQTITIDAAPTEESSNAVSSGGVFNAVSQLAKEMGNPSTPELTIEQGAISSQNGTNTSANNRIRTNNFIVADGIGIATSGNKVYVMGYKSDGTFVSPSGWITTNNNVYIDGADKYRLVFAYSGDGRIGPSDFSSLGITILALHRGDFVKVVSQDLTETQKETARVNIGAIPESVVLNNAFKLAGAGETAVTVELTLMPNSKYKMAITNPSWGYSGSNTKLSLKPTGGSTMFYYSGQNEVPGEIYFSTGNSDKYTLSVRANAGVSFEYFFEELNDISTGILMGAKPYLTFAKTESGWTVAVNSSTKLFKDWKETSVSPSGTFTFADTDKLLVYRASSNTLELIGTANQRTDTVLLDYRSSSKNFVGGLFYSYFIAKRISDYDIYVAPSDFEFSEYGQVSWSALSVKKENGDILTFSTGSYLVNSANWLILIDETGNLALSSRSLIKTADIILLGVQEGTYIGPLAYYIEQQKLTSWYGDEYELDVKRNGEQLKNVKWTPKADVRTNEGLNPAGVEVTGVPYSSVKELEKFIGVDVSLHTFMTAVNNVHSLFYTEKVGESNSQSAYGKTYHGVNCISYYGSVCSAFVDACLSLKNRFDSWLYQTSPKTFHILDPQDEQNLRVGDVISEDGHGAIITRIYRDLSGRITDVEVSEHNAPLATSKYGAYYLERLRVASNGVYCRRNNLGFVKYEPSPFVLADGEPLYRKGDLVFVDSASDRSFYLCETPNRDAAWDNASWSKIVAFATGSQINKGSYRQYGERLYRCKVTHTPTEFVPANWQYIPGVKEWTPYPYVYNDDIVTFAGDRAAFALGNDIYINFNKGSYTSMQIYNEETLVDTVTLGDGYQVDVTSICNTPGLYKARLTDGVNYSRYTYFEVIDAIATASFENCICTMNYSSVYGKPIGAQIVERSGYPVCRFDLDGGSSITIDPQAGFYRQSWPYYKRAENYPKTVYARVVFAGEYGNVVSPMVELGEISAITGTLIYPDTPIDLGVLSGANTLILADGTQGERYDFSFTAGSGLSISLRRTEGKMRWMEEHPTIVEGKTYFFSVVNGAVTWQVAD